MANFRLIRGNFIREYAERQSQMWNAGWQLISERDSQHRMLNVEFKYAEPDGSFGAGCKNHIDQQYKQRLNEIEFNFRKIYDQTLPIFYDWCRSQGMTIFEFMLFDDIDSGVLKQIVAEYMIRDEWNLFPIQLRARFFVQKLKEEYYVGGIRKRLDMDISHQRYARLRCRKFFGLRFWDFAAQKAIFDYSVEWKRALNSAFDGMIAAN